MSRTQQLKDIEILLRECAYHRQVAKLLDGKLHDDVEFEILACEFKK